MSGLQCFHQRTEASSPIGYDQQFRNVRGLSLDEGVHQADSPRREILRPAVALAFAGDSLDVRHLIRDQQGTATVLRWMAQLGDADMARDV